MRPVCVCLGQEETQVILASNSAISAGHNDCDFPFSFFLLACFSVAKPKWQSSVVYHDDLIINNDICLSFCVSGWPSGVRRCVQLAVSSGGVGSNPTSDIASFLFSPLRLASFLGLLQVILQLSVFRTASNVDLFLNKSFCGSKAYLSFSQSFLQSQLETAQYHLVLYNLGVQSFIQ